MALKKCKECTKEVSTKALSCPHCGCPTKSQNNFIGCSIATIIFILLFWVAKEIFLQFSEVRIFGRKLKFR